MKKMMMVGVGLMALGALAGEVSVAGGGSVWVKPDMMRLSFNIETIDKDMAKSAEMFAAKNAEVVRKLMAEGVASNEVTTSSVRMDPRYQYADKDGRLVSEWDERGFRVFDGYCHSAECVFKAPLDRARLERIYRVIVGLQPGDNLRLSFFVQDMDKPRAEARRRAVRTARSRAEELCAAAGVALGPVEKINYMTRGDGCFDAVCPAPSRKIASSAAKAEFVLPAISIDDIEVTDVVEIVWKLKEQ